MSGFLSITKNATVTTIDKDPRKSEMVSKFGNFYLALTENAIVLSAGLCDRKKVERGETKVKFHIFNADDATKTLAIGLEFDAHSGYSVSQTLSVADKKAIRKLIDACVLRGIIPAPTVDENGNIRINHKLVFTAFEDTLGGVEIEDENGEPVIAVGFAYSDKVEKDLEKAAILQAGRTPKVTKEATTSTTSSSSVTPPSEGEYL